MRQASARVLVGYIPVWAISRPIIQALTLIVFTPGNVLGFHLVSLRSSHVTLCYRGGVYTGHRTMRVLRPVISATASGPGFEHTAHGLTKHQYNMVCMVCVYTLYGHVSLPLPLHLRVIHRTRVKFPCVPNIYDRIPSLEVVL